MRRRVLSSCILFLEINEDNDDIERMTVDRIPRNALHPRFEGKGNKGKLRLCWIDNINEDITWTDIKGGSGLDK